MRGGLYRPVAAGASCTRSAGERTTVREFAVRTRPGLRAKSRIVPGARDPGVSLLSRFSPLRAAADLSRPARAVYGRRNRPPARKPGTTSASPRRPLAAGLGLARRASPSLTPGPAAGADQKQKRSRQGRRERDQQDAEHETADERRCDGEGCDRWGCTGGVHGNLHVGDLRQFSVGGSTPPSHPSRWGSEPPFRG